MEAIIKNIRGYVTERRIKLAVRFILGGVFIVAGVSKLFDPQLLFSQIGKIGIKDDFIVQLCSYGLVVFEILLGSLIICWFRQWVAITTGAVLTGFCLFLGYLVYTHDPSTCGCFGNFVHFGNKQELLNNLLLVTGIVYLMPEKKFVYQQNI